MKSASLPVTLADVRETLLCAGQIVRRYYEAPSDSIRKQDGSPLTRADTETNEFLRKHLLKLFPGAGWLSEESEDDPRRLQAEWVWIVDPLDGTKEFTRRIPELAVSIGLVRNQQVVLSGVFNPITNEGGVAEINGHLEFWGFNERPTRRESGPRPVLGGSGCAQKSACDDLQVSPAVVAVVGGDRPQSGTSPTMMAKSASLLATARASVSRTELDAGDIAPYVPYVGEAKPVGSVAYKLLRVAAGVDDFTFSVQPKSEWDICGGIGLLRFTGRNYARLDGKPTLFNQANPRIACGAVAGPEPLAEEFRVLWKELRVGNSEFLSRRTKSFHFLFAS